MVLPPENVRWVQAKKVRHVSEGCPCAVVWTLFVRYSLSTYNYLGHDNHAPTDRHCAHDTPRPLSPALQAPPPTGLLL